MRKNFKFVATVATLLIAAAGVITFEACNKKNEVVNNIPELNVAELSDMDKEMILFGEKMKSATKGGETMQLDEAVRNLSNYENFKMCDASRYSVDMERLTIESEIPVTNGNVYLSDINAIYESNRKQIKDKLASLEGDDKTVYCVYSRIDGNSKDGGDVRVVTDAWLYRPLDLIMPEDFNNTDSWYDFERLGRCDTNLFVGYDATMIMNKVINDIFLPLPELPGYRIVFYNTVNPWTLSCYWEDENNPYGPYGLYYREDYYTPVCLSPEELAYYKNNIINRLHNDEVTLHKTVISISFEELIPYCFLDYYLADVVYTYVGNDDY